MQFAVAGLANASVMREGEDVFTLDPSVIISRQKENLSKIQIEVRAGVVFVCAGLFRSVHAPHFVHSTQQHPHVPTPIAYGNESRTNENTIFI